MRQKVVFDNEGEIDPRVISVMGISAKQEGSIGYFGTGLKYAIATILRNGLDIEVTSGEDVYRFGLKTLGLRGQDFDIVCMNGQELGFTTELGKNWELWQAFRELYSNCLDESGEAWVTDHTPVVATEGRTRVVVRGREFIEIWEKKDRIFIPEDAVSWVSAPSGEVYRSRKSDIFYRGVNVKSDEPFMYCYNLLNQITLTEDRTAKHMVEVLTEVAKIAAESDNEAFIEQIITAEDPFSERRLPFEHLPFASETFFNVVARVKQERPADLNKSAQRLYIRFYGEEKAEEAELSKYEETQFEKAMQTAEALGFSCRNLKIEIYESLGYGKLASAVWDPERKILLSKNVFSCGSDELTKALIEETVHLKYGFDDCTREFQNFLIDKMLHFGLEKLELEKS